MALSGSVTTSEYEGRSVTFKWSATQSVDANTSSISWSLVGSGSGGGWVVVSELRVKCDGVQRYYRSSSNHTDCYQGTVLATGNFTISHNADGTKSFPILIEAGIYNWAINCSGSGTAVLNTIPRASSVSCGSFTLGSAGTITISRASSAFKHTLTYHFGDVKGTIVTKTSQTSVSWTPPLSLANQIPSAVQGKGTIICTTYSGDTNIGTKTCGFTASVPSSVKPGVPSITAAEATSGLASKFGFFIQNHSRLKVTTSASGSYGSTIKTIKVSFDGVNYTGSPVTTNVCRNSGSKTITVTVTDSRGRMNSATKSVSITAYSPPKINALTVYRARDSSGTEDPMNGTYCYAKVSYTITPLNSKNNKSAYVRFKLHTASSYSSWWSNSSAYSYNSHISKNGFTTDSQYDIKLTVSDYFGTAEAVVTLPTAAVIMDFRETGKGVAIGKVSESDIFEVAFPARFANTLTAVNGSSDMNVVSEIVGIKNRLSAVYVTAKGTKNGWTYYKLSDGNMLAFAHKTGSVKHYTTQNGFYGFNAWITLPFTMADTNYEVFESWKISNGFTIQCGCSGKSKTQAQILALSNISGTASYTLELCVFGKTA